MAEPLPTSFHSDYLDQHLRGFRSAGVHLPGEVHCGPSYMSSSFIVAAGDMEPMVIYRIQCRYCTVVNTGNDDGRCHACGAPLPNRLGQ